LIDFESSSQVQTPAVRSKTPFFGALEGF